MSFKSKKCGGIRKPKVSSSSESDDEEDTLLNTLKGTKELQKLRRRPHGVSAVGLALGKRGTAIEEMAGDDPFKMKNGGVVNMKALKSGKLTDADGMAIGTAFSAETNRRDEDADMMKYIEEELAKRKGTKSGVEAKQTKTHIFSHKEYKDSNEESTSSNDCFKSPEDALYEVPEHLRVSSSKKSEEMLSNQMLSGIPEVDLGIEAKIRNIEATEDAKQRLLREKLNKKDTPSQFVPTNMAVNFVQHNRFNIEEEAPKPKRFKEIKPVPVVGEAEGGGVIFRKEEKKTTRNRDEEEKATDDFHFEKFKKQFRRY